MYIIAITQYIEYVHVSVPRAYVSKPIFIGLYGNIKDCTRILRVLSGASTRSSPAKWFPLPASHYIATKLYGWNNRLINKTLRICLKKRGRESYPEFQNFYSNTCITL